MPNPTPKPGSKQQKIAAPKVPKTLRTATLPDHEPDDEAELARLEFDGLDLSEIEASVVHIEESRLIDVNFSRTTLQRAIVMDTTIERSDLANLTGESSSLVRVEVNGCRATGFRWIDGTIRHVTFSRSRMDLSVFWETKFEKVRFEECNLSKVDFADADLTGVEFVDCDLTQARLAGTKMGGTRLTNCVLDGISHVTSLRGAIVDADDLLGLTYALAQGLGIEIADKDD